MLCLQDSRLCAPPHPRKPIPLGISIPGCAFQLYNASPEAQIETFLMSNVCPQTPTLNCGTWRALEEEERA